MPPRTRKNVDPDAPKTVKVTLAHPLGDDPVGATVEVTVERARSLIGAGYVQGVDPSDAAAVAEALGDDKSAAAAEAEQQQQDQNGSGE